MRASPATVNRLVRARDIAGLVAAYEPLARSVAGLYYAHGLTHEDLVQEARIGLMYAARDFRGEPARFNGFARLCIERQVITAVKTALRGKHGPLNDAKSFTTPVEDGSKATLADILPLHGSDPAERMEVAERLAELLRVLDCSLSALERAAVIGFNLGGLSYVDLAAALGTTERSVDNALQRARIKLALPCPLEPEPEQGTLLVCRQLHRTEDDARREAERVRPGCHILAVHRRKVRQGRVVAPQGRAAGDGSLGRPVWAVEIAA